MLHSTAFAQYNGTRILFICILNCNRVCMTLRFVLSVVLLIVDQLRHS